MNVNSINGFVDTNVLIYVFRGVSVANEWYASQKNLAVSSIAWLEFIEGARGVEQNKRCLLILSRFTIVTLTDDDQRWAMQTILKYGPSYGVGLKDSLIASVCHRLQVPLYTMNVKDFTPILGANLIVKPYELSKP